MYTNTLNLLIKFVWFICTIIDNIQAGYFDRVCKLWAAFYEESDKILQQPHKCFLRAEEEIKNSLWLKYGNRVPLIKAPMYKDHIKEKKIESEPTNAEEWRIPLV